MLQQNTTTGESGSANSQSTLGEVLDLDTELPHGNTWSAHHEAMRHHHGGCTRSVSAAVDTTAPGLITSPPRGRPVTSNAVAGVGAAAVLAGYPVSQRRRG